MGTESWNVNVYSNQERTMFGCELWAKEKKIYESECCYSKLDAENMAEELKLKFGIKQ
jgi:hypothetical protein